MPLHAASEAGHAEVVRLLLDKNADIIVAQKHGWTPLFLAAINGCADVVKSFLGHYKAEAASQGSHGRTALFCAARFGRHEVVQLLLATGWFQPSKKDWCGSTPLFAAARNGHTGTVTLLLAAEEHLLNCEDRFGRNLIWWARRAGSTEITQLLLRHAEYAHTYVSDDDSRPDTCLITFDPNVPWCDGCTLSIPDGYPHGRCEEENHCDLCLCMECINLGMIPY